MQIASTILGIDLRLDAERFGDRLAQRSLIQQTLDELRASTVYLPAAGDRDASRREARLMTLETENEVPLLNGYETATTDKNFLPTRLVDVHAQMVRKIDALASYQAFGAARVDLLPRMARAYARYWGRWTDFTEVEAFEEVKWGSDRRRANPRCPIRLRKTLRFGELTAPQDGSEAIPAEHWRLPCI